MRQSTRHSWWIVGILGFGSWGLAADCSGSITITKTADLSKLSTCPTYDGYITVQSIFLDTKPTPVPGGSEGVSNPRIEVDGLKKINGDLTISDNAVSEGDDFGVAFPSLEYVVNLEFSNMSSFLMPEFSKLQHADTITFSHINFTGHTVFGTEQWPALQSVLSISATNTTMTTLGDWDRSLVWLPPQDYLEINPGFTPFLELTAIDNPQLNDISLSAYSNTSNSIMARLAANGNDLQVEFVEFDTASLWIQDAAGFVAKELKNVLTSSTADQQFQKSRFLTNQTIPPGFTDNLFTTLSLPKVSKIADQFMVKNNTYLSDLSLPSLKGIDLMVIAENPELKDVELPKMGDIEDSLSISGSFNSLRFPSLTDTNGNLSIDSTNGRFSCSGLDDKQKHALFVKGTYSCSSSGSGLSTGAKAGIGVGVGLGVLILLALLGFWWGRRRKQANPRASEKTTTLGDSESSHSEDIQGTTELHESNLKELESQAPPPELPSLERRELTSIPACRATLRAEPSHRYFVFKTNSSLQTYLHWCEFM